MPWNPEIYNKFKNIRYQPFFDLADLIRPAEKMKAIDLGCGTGEQTAILTDKFRDAVFLGVDTSAEMLEKSKTLESDRLHFRRSSTEAVISSEEKWDLIFSNAALQWSDDHKTLLPALIRNLNTGGQFAVQMPVQNENLLNSILFDLVQVEPFKGFLQGWKRSSPVLSIDEYARILFEQGLATWRSSKKFIRS
jgi:trans-aconitate 2-methyltransferase